MIPLKTVESILTSPPAHWVGDGFPVRSVFSPQSVRNRLSPYILFDYAGPTRFEPADTPRGVETHPHRGFETVTVVFQGELEHRDSAGNGGSIGPGDVQWMTAASGILHEEKHSREFTHRGGTLETAQLWVNLPARHKMSAPKYQQLLRQSIPTIELVGGAGHLRAIAGDFNGTAAAASIFSPVILWDISLRGHATLRLPLPDGYASALFVRSGAIRVGESQAVDARKLALLSREGADVTIRSDSDSELLLVGGEPIDEPMAAFGPFVMNTQEEIRAAFRDVQEGRFGRLD